MPLHSLPITHHSLLVLKTVPAAAVIGCPGTIGATIFHRSLVGLFSPSLPPQGPDITIIDFPNSAHQDRSRDQAVILSTQRSFFRAPQVASIRRS